MASNWLDSFVGHHITALTGAPEERSDTGTLVKIADGWLQIAKDNGDMVLIPSTAIRLIKLLDMTQTVGAITSLDNAPVVAPMSPDAPLNNPAVNRFPDGF